MANHRLGINPKQTAATAASLGGALGDIAYVRDDDAGAWRMVLAGEVLAAHQCCAVMRPAESGALMTMAHATTLNGQGRTAGRWLGGIPRVEVAMSAYGWLATEGAAMVQVAANTAAYVPLDVSTTAGMLSAVSTGGVLVSGITLTTARGSGDGPAPALMREPSVLRMIASYESALTSTP